MKRLFILVMALALLFTACSTDNATDNSAASSPDTTQSDNSGASSGETEADSANTPAPLPVGDPDLVINTESTDSDKLPAPPTELGEAPDDLAYSYWTYSGGTSYQQSATSSSNGETAKVFTLTGGLGSGDRPGSTTFSSGATGDNYCLDYTTSVPHYDRDGNLHTLTNATSLHKSLSNTQIDTIEKIMDAYNDASYWSNGQYQTRLYDGIASAVWSVTDGHGLTNDVARDIMQKVQNGTYTNNPSVYWLKSDSRSIQDQIAIVPPASGPTTRPVPTATATPAGGECAVTLFDFPKGGGELATLTPGTYNFDGNLGWLNDDVESIYVPAGMKISVSQHYNQGGWTMTHQGPGTFEVNDDEISWIKIEGDCNPAPEPTTPPAPTAVPTTPPTATPVPTTPPTSTPVPTATPVPTTPPAPVLGALGDYVWFDRDADGVQDSDEPGLPGVVVTATNGSGTSFTDTTDASGAYLIEDLPAGTYDVAVDTSTLPNGLVQTFDLDGNLNDSSRENLTEGETNLTHDFGYTAPPDPASIGDYVWIDADEDGVQDADEAPLAGVDVRLYDANTVRIATATTDANGLYLFDDLTPGDYSVSVDATTLPDGYSQTWDLDGVLDNSSYETLSSGEDNRDHDFGYVPAPVGSIGDYVWQDDNRDGVQDRGEAGIGDVVVNLLVDGQVVSTTQTDSNGAYLFGDLPEDCYEVQVDASSLPAGMEQTYDEDSTLDNTSSECLDPGEDDRAQDFGYAPLLGSIGDYVWQDDDRDGVQDASESPISGVTVELRESNGRLVATDTTDDAGAYLFEDLAPDCYTVGVVAASLPAGMEQTYDEDGTLDNTSSECLDPGENDREQDFGYVLEVASIGDRVWFDSTSDGEQDAFEIGIEDVTLELLDASGAVVATDVTDVNGEYLFEDLVPACYSVRVVTSTLPTGVSQTYDEDGTLDHTSSECLDPGENDREQDFGYVVFAD